MKFTIVHLEISKLSHYIVFYEEKLQIFYSVTNSIKYINFWGALIDIFCRASGAKHLSFVYRVTYRRIQLYNGLGEETIRGVFQLCCTISKKMVYITV